MNSNANNPPLNIIGSGITEDALAAAVSKSGYPLQTVVGMILRSYPGFQQVQEEWNYIDEETKEARALDILVNRLLYDPLTQEQPRVRPHLSLLIECKQSALPYVFFLSSNKKLAPNFPLLAGLFRHTMTITTDDTPSTWTFPILRGLDLYTHPFILDDPMYCTTFSKCVRKGSDLELSGSESFNGLVLPLMKAMRYFRQVESPPDTASYFDCHLVIGIGVLDAPMVGVDVSETGNQLIYTPCVRVIRLKLLTLIMKIHST